MTFHITDSVTDGDNIQTQGPEGIPDMPFESMGLDVASIQIQGPNGEIMSLHDMFDALKIPENVNPITDHLTPQEARDILAGAKALGDVKTNPFTLETETGESTGYFS